ncbi:hypothetical protein FRC03_000625 [Tulasnella sp. 419]|nr:hypothetical protein FRC02_005657 [Tulasnella sp. 418]KAG8969799.1 hypothetical protein FRC03_000625 [Tulasnella sp. 419]
MKSFLYVFTLLAGFQLAVAAPVPVRRETNADRLARGLPPLAPVKRAPQPVYARAPAPIPSLRRRIAA